MRIRVSHYNSYLSGGAAKAALRIFETIPENFDKIFFTLDEPPTPCYNQIWNKAPIYRKLQSYYFYKNQAKINERRPPGFETFTSPRTPLNTKVDKSANLIHLHWISNLIDYSSFFGSIKNNTPIVWTLHDFNPMTGGCHYPENCTGYHNECSDCPQLSVLDKSISLKNFEYKTEAYLNKNLHLVATSQFVFDCLDNSSLFRSYPRYKIQYGFDVNQFVVLDKKNCREKLCLPNDQMIIGFGASEISRKNKGFSVLIEALNLIDVNYHLVVFGNRMDGLLDSIQEQKYTYLGFLETSEQLNEAYSVCDLMVFPSYYETFGQIYSESILSGTYVISTDNGGIRDQMPTEFYEYLTPPGNPQKLSQSIQAFNDNKDFFNGQLGSRQKYLRDNLNVEIQARKYTELYLDLV